LSPADLAKLDTCSRFFRSLTEALTHEQARIIHGTCLPLRKVESWTELLHFVSLSKTGTRSKTGKKVAGGTYHSLVVTESGDLLTFGDGAMGQLGREIEMHEMPKLVVAFLGYRKVVEVAAGDAFSLAVTERGELFSFGSGLDGRLGHGDEKDSLVPRHVEGLQEQFVVKVCAGSDHALVVSREGTLYSHGLGEHGRLGHGDELTQKAPKLVTRFRLKRSRREVAGVSAGSAHSMVVTQCGELYTFGRGAAGRLGHGDEDTRLVPKLVEAFADAREAKVLERLLDRLINHCYTVCTLITHCYTVCTLINHCYTVCTLINHCYTVCTLINHCYTVCTLINHCIIIQGVGETAG
jgi:hypothetical protein